MGVLLLALEITDIYGRLVVFEDWCRIMGVSGFYGRLVVLRIGAELWASGVSGLIQTNRAEHAKNKQS